MTAPELAHWMAQGQLKPVTVLDVREDWEYAHCHLPESVHIPMHKLNDQLDALPREKPVVCVCHHGIRSYRVALMLANEGFEVLNLQGGIQAWSELVDPSCPTY